MEFISTHVLCANRSLAYHDAIADWPDADRLRQSIKRRGILQPLLVFDSQAELQIINGFRRFDIALELGLNPINVHLFRGDLKDGFLQILEEHSGGLPFNLRERARAIHIGLNYLGLTLDEVSQKILPPLNLSPQPHLAVQYLKLTLLPPALLDLFVRKDFSLRRCLPFCECRPEEAELLAKVALQLDLGGRQIEEISTALLEISRREELGLEQVINELNLLQPFLSEDKRDMIRSALQRIEQRRLPETYRLRRELSELSKNFADGEIELHLDPNFSNENIKLIMNIKRFEELERNIKKLNDPTTQGQIRMILQKLY